MKTTPYNTLIPTGSRVQCGDIHHGVLVNYFTGLYWNKNNLFGVIHLDKEYWIEDPGTFINLLVVHADNLEREKSESL